LVQGSADGLRPPQDQAWAPPDRTALNLDSLFFSGSIVALGGQYNCISRRKTSREEPFPPPSV
jgi:hypothetical protein